MKNVRYTIRHGIISRYNDVFVTFWSIFGTKVYPIIITTKNIIKMEKYFIVNNNYYYFVEFSSLKTLGTLTSILTKYRTGPNLQVKNSQDQGSTHHLVRGPLGASWSEIFQVSLVLVRS